MSRGRFMVDLHFQTCQKCGIEISAGERSLANHTRKCQYAVRGESKFYSCNSCNYICRDQTSLNTHYQFFCAGRLQTDEYEDDERMQYVRLQDELLGKLEEARRRRHKLTPTMRHELWIADFVSQYQVSQAGGEKLVSFLNNEFIEGTRRSRLAGYRTIKSRIQDGQHYPYTMKPIAFDREHTFHVPAEFGGDCNDEYIFRYYHLQQCRSIHY
jgi:hypothetical protein